MSCTDGMVRVTWDWTSRGTTGHERRFTFNESHNMAHCIYILVERERAIVELPNLLKTYNLRTAKSQFMFGLSMCTHSVDDQAIQCQKFSIDMPRRACSCLPNYVSHRKQTSLKSHRGLLSTVMHLTTFLEILMCVYMYVHHISQVK